MIRARRYGDDVPAGSIVVRVVRSGDQIEGFIHDVDEPHEPDSTYATEQKPIDQVWRLVENKLNDMPGATVFVQMEAGIDWDPSWGEMQD